MMKKAMRKEFTFLKSDPKPAAKLLTGQPVDLTDILVELL